LKLEILRELRDDTQIVTSIENIVWLDVDQFYGIEYGEFASKIAEVAMWLIDHQMNMKISEEFGQYFVRLPLTKSATIVHGNSLKIKWEEIITPKHLSYILGNPPFLGHHYQNTQQKEDLENVFFGRKGIKVLDYSCVLV